MARWNGINSRMIMVRLLREGDNFQCAVIGELEHHFIEHEGNY